MEDRRQQQITKLNSNDGEIWVATTILYMELSVREGENMRNVVREITDLLDATVPLLSFMLPDIYSRLLDMQLRIINP